MAAMPRCLRSSPSCVRGFLVPSPVPCIKRKAPATHSYFTGTCRRHVRASCPVFASTNLGRGTPVSTPQPDTCLPATPHQSQVASLPLTALGMAVAASAALAMFLPSAAMAVAEGAGTSSNLLSSVLGFVLHLDKHLSALIQQYGTATYAILWGIVFCETGLVITPFLPGDSLLFACGAFAGMGVLNLPILLAVLMSAAILGDAVNYAIGNKLGSWMTREGLVNPKYIKKTEDFYDKYGGKTIVLARFLPIVRTFAPFVAGVGKMDYGRFALYNITGAIVWTLGFCGAGFFFGNLPAVKHNFTLVVLGIIVVSCVPVVWEVYNASRGAGKQGEQGTSNSAA